RDLDRRGRGWPESCRNHRGPTEPGGKGHLQRGSNGGGSLCRHATRGALSGFDGFEVYRRWGTFHQSLGKARKLSVLSKGTVAGTSKGIGPSQKRTDCLH